MHSGRAGLLFRAGRAQNTSSSHTSGTDRMIEMMQMVMM